MFLVLSLAISALISGAFTSDLSCTLQGGTCVDWRYYVCNAGVETGLCDGDSNRRCCLECDALWYKSFAERAVIQRNTCTQKDNFLKNLKKFVTIADQIDRAYRKCDTSKGRTDKVRGESNENNWDSCCDSSCKNAGGNCQDDSNYCSGSYQSGMCGGPSSRKCCGASGTGGGSCSLLVYSSLYIKGYNGLAVEYEPGFKSSLDTLNGYARTCGVTVYVTHAFRDENQSITDPVVPPATFSNHLVGHAIDFNLDTPSGWCNGDCLYAGYNADAECFIQKVMNNNSLRWGGLWSPSDPVHIDDGLNGNNPSQWDSLYYQLQGACN